MIILATLVLLLSGLLVFAIQEMYFLKKDNSKLRIDISNLKLEKHILLNQPAALEGTVVDNYEAAIDVLENHPLVPSWDNEKGLTYKRK